MAGVQMQVPLARPLERTLVYLEPAIRHGYAWLFPRGAAANLGLGCRVQAKPQKRLDELRSRLLAQGLILPGVLALAGGAIPVGGPRPEMAKGRVLLAGDAAGLTHPVTGAGIPQAVFSGAEAGQAAARLACGQPEAGQEYQHEVAARYGRHLARGLAARAEMERGWDAEDFAGLMARVWPAWEAAVASLDQALDQARALSWQHHGAKLGIYLPGMFTAYGRKGRYPAVSITGQECRQGCDHCRGQLLRTMRPACGGEALYALGKRLAAQGQLGMLISGGSDPQGRLPWDSVLGASNAWPGRPTWCSPPTWGASARPRPGPSRPPGCARRSSTWWAARAPREGCCTCPTAWPPRAKPWPPAPRPGWRWCPTSSWAWTTAISSGSTTPWNWWPP